MTVGEGARLLVDLKEWEFLDPEQRPASRGLGREQADEGEAQRAQHLGRDERLVGGEDDEVAGLAADLVDERGLLGLGEELDDGAAQRAAVLHVDVGHALGAVLLASSVSLSIWARER